MTTHEEFKKRLSLERQDKIKARSAQLLAEELTLRDLRKALRMSQETVADLLGMRQGDLSKFERRSDAYLSTIRRYVEAMGGTLDLVAKFPDREPVHLINIGDLDEHDESEIEELHSHKASSTDKKQPALAAPAQAKSKKR